MLVTETKKTERQPRVTPKAKAAAKRVVAPRTKAARLTSAAPRRKTSVKQIEKPQPVSEQPVNNALLDLAHGIVEAISDKLGEKIVLMDLRQQTPFTDYFVVCSANSARQIKAIYDGVREHTLKNFSVKPRRIEGSTDSGWVLMDYSGIVVHIFAPTQRQFYQLEDLWKESLVVLKMQ